LASGVPIDPSGASTSAPASINALATSESSLLAAQWSGVSSPGLRAFGSGVAPAQRRRLEARVVSKELPERGQVTGADRSEQPFWQVDRWRHVTSMVHVPL
jgi:hypothetical protein